MENELNLSNSELVVMRVIWSLQEVSADKIGEELDDSFHWAASTIKTFLARLVKKGLLNTRKDGHRFLYSPTRSEDEAVAQMTTEFLRKICARKHTAVLLQMVESSDYTESDRLEVEMALSQKETVSEVACDCLDNMQYCACE